MFNKKAKVPHRSPQYITAIKRLVSETTLLHLPLPYINKTILDPVCQNVLDPIVLIFWISLQCTNLVKSLQIYVYHVSLPLITFLDTTSINPDLQGNIFHAQTPD